MLSKNELLESFLTIFILFRERILVQLAHLANLIFFVQVLQLGTLFLELRQSLHLDTACAINAVNFASLSIWTLFVGKELLLEKVSSIRHRAKS